MEVSVAPGGGGGGGVSQAYEVPKPLYDWTVDEVSNFLAGCSWVPTSFRHRLRLHQIDGLALGELTKEDMREDFGISELGTIKRILRHIQKLKTGSATQSGPAAGLSSLLAHTAADSEWVTMPSSQLHPAPFKQKRVQQNTTRAVDRILPKPADGIAPADPPPDQAEQGAASPAPALPAAAAADAAGRVGTPKRANIVQMNLSLEDSLLPKPAKSARVSHPNPVRRENRAVQAMSAGSFGIGGRPLSGKDTPQAQQQSAAGARLVPLDSPPVLPQGEPDAPFGCEGDGGVSAASAIRTPATTIRENIRPVSARASLAMPLYRPGILELERRFLAIGELFTVWDASSDVSVDGSGYIETEELRDVLASFYNWSESDKGAQAQSLMELIDFNGDGQLDRDEFHRYISEMTLAKHPMEFDHLIIYLNRAVSEASRLAEETRRRKGLLGVFQQWDWDGSGYIETDELRKVLVRYNDWSHRQGKHSAQVILTQRDENRDERLDEEEFLDLFTLKAARLRPEEFDYMVFRMKRCVQDLLEDEKEGMADAFKPVTVNELETEWKESDPATPLLLYGLCVDPAMQIENLATRHGITVRSFLVQHIKSERVALKEMVRWGCGRGQWIYITLGDGYPNYDGFLRSVGVALRQQSTYLLHKRFRLWLMVNTTRIMSLPRILRLNSVSVSLDALRNEKIDKMAKDGSDNGIVSDEVVTAVRPNALLH